METTGLFWDFIATQSVQVAMVFGVVAGVNWMLRNRSAHIRYLLWLVVLVKCVTPPVVTFSLPVLPEKPQSLMPLIGQIETKMPGMPEEAVPVEPVYIEPEPAVNTVVPVSEQVQANLAPQGNLNAAETERPGLSRAMLWVMLWAAGVACYLLWALGRAMLLGRRLKCNRRPLPAELMIEQIETLARLWDYPGGFNVWLMDGIGQPFVWGLWRGAIYLPTRFQSIQTDRQKAIVIHEMAHVVRLDAFVNLLQILIQGVFWFHPLVWLANRVIRQEREKCCDEIAVARLGTAPREYGSAIVDTLLQEVQTSLAIPTLAVAGPVKNIEDRIKTIMQPGRRFLRRPSIAAMLIIGLLAAVIVPTTIALTHKVTPPDYMLSGTVMDAQSGQPIAGAIVLDDGYGPQPYQKGITDDEGKFEYKSWNEEHTITAKADGYHSQSMVFMTWPLDNSKQLNFTLRKLSTQNNSRISIDLRTISISNDEAQLKALLDKAGVHLPQFAMSVTPGDVNTQVPDKLSYGQSAFLTRHEVEKIIEVMQSNPDVRLLCSPKVIVFSGESANLEISGAQTAPAGQKEFSVHITPTAAANGILSEFRLILSDSPGGQENPLTQLTQIESEVLIPQDKTLLIICPDFYQDSAGQQTAVSKPQRRLLILLKTQVESASETQSGESSDASAGIAMSKRIDLVPAEFDLQIDSQRGVCFPVVTIANDGKVALPKMKLRFYRGSPDQNRDEVGDEHRGWHEAGPIEPGNTWRERTDGFHLDDGVYEFAVVLDYDHAIAETDETNNAMSMQIKVVNGQVVEKLAASSIPKQRSPEAQLSSSQLAGGIIEAILLPEYLESHTVLSLKTGRVMPQQQADDLKEPYLFYAYTFPPGQSPSQYTVNTIPERYIGVEAGGVNTGGFGWAPESSGLQHLWSIDRIEDLPDCPQRATITIGNMTTHGTFIGLPLTEPEREKQWPFITAFKGDDGTCGVFEITKVENRKIHVRFQVLNPSETENIRNVQLRQLSSFATKLSNGVMVELLGVCNHPGKDDSWWGADGKAIAVPSFKAKMETEPMKAIPTQYTLLVRATGGGNKSMHMKIYEGFGYSTPFAEDGTALCIVKHPEPEKAYHQDTFEKGPVMIGVAQGDWIKARDGGISAGITMPSSFLVGVEDHVVVQPPQQDKPDSGVTVFWATATSCNYELKLVCTLKDGTNRENMRAYYDTFDIIETGGLRNSALKTINFSFDRLPIDLIDGYELYCRPYEYARFENVAFKAGLNTDVKILTENQSGNSSAGGKSEAEPSRTILLERQELLQKILETEEKKFQSGISGPVEVLEAKLNLLAVEKELAGTTQERIAVLQQIAALRQEAENTTKLMFESGRTTEAALNQAKLERLKAEEELARAEAAGEQSRGKLSRVQIPAGAAIRVSNALHTISNMMLKIETEWKDQNWVQLADYFDRINETCDDLEGKNGTEIPDVSEWGQLPSRLVDILELLHKIEETAEGCRSLAAAKQGELLEQHWKTLKGHYGTLCLSLQPKRQENVEAGNDKRQLDDKLRDLSYQIAVEARIVFLDAIALKEGGLQDPALGTSLTGLADSEAIQKLLKSKPLVLWDTPALTTIDDLQAAFIQKAFTQSKDVRQLTAPRVMGLNKQWMMIKAVQPVTYVDSRSQPQSIDEGVLLDVLPEIMPDEKSVRLAFRLLITEIVKSQDGKPLSSVPVVSATEIQYAAVVADQRTVWLIGPEVTSVTKEDALESKRLCVMIKPTLVKVQNSGHIMNDV